VRHSAPIGNPRDGSKSRANSFGFGHALIRPCDWTKIADDRALRFLLDVRRTRRDLFIASSKFSRSAKHLRTTKLLLRKMAEITEFGPRKTIFILAIVAGCFAVLWPKIFYPMLTASVTPHHPVSDSSGKSSACDK